MKIVITDLTRFKNQDKVCTAGVADDGTVYRPMPYLASDRCRELEIHPGGILDGKFTLARSAAPHVEDASFSDLTFEGPCTKQEFRDALEATLYDSLSDGFGCDIGRNQKCIPVDTTPPRSLITIKVNPHSFSVVQNNFDPSQLKSHFFDGRGTELSFVSVTDRGFYDYSQQHSDEAAKIAEMRQFIHGQKELYLRIGLSRAFQAPDGRNGYWIQVNGIYTFPNYMKYIRCYD